MLVKLTTGDKEVALGPTNLFFPNRVPFLIPIGTDEDEEEVLKFHFRFYLNSSKKLDFVWYKTYFYESI